MTSSLVENPRLRTDIAKLKQSLDSKEVKDYVHEPKGRMLADVLTKHGSSGFQLMNILRTGSW